MFDPQMLMSMFGNMSGMGNLGNLGNMANLGNMFNLGGSNGEQDGNQGNPMMNMFGNPNMLSGLMQMMNNNSNSAPPLGKNTYINKVSTNSNINSELYKIIKSAESITWYENYYSSCNFGLCYCCWNGGYFALNTSEKYFIKFIILIPLNKKITQNLQKYCVNFLSFVNIFFFDNFA